MNITNRVAIDLATATAENAPCPTWLVCTLVGLAVALIASAIITIIAVNK